MTCEAELCQSHGRTRAFTRTHTQTPRAHQSHSRNLSHRNTSTSSSSETVTPFLASGHKHTVNRSNQKLETNLKSLKGDGGNGSYITVKPHTGRKRETRGLRGPCWVRKKEAEGRCHVLVFAGNDDSHSPGHWTLFI